ncbi:c-type cytochrome biogenesis protein CcmI [Algirhabdus cladophorae]|uniref:c-type cytochrome biogenesis protein CcmI n=1 Tax=Algirhabdus cladophorae TaxID=3377108 RepID=UPI003B8460D9
MGFWIISILLAVGVAAILVLALLQNQRTQRAAASYDVQVYRDQLKEIDRDLARGIVTKDEADALKTEVSRRLLAADALSQSQSTTEAKDGAPRIAALVVAPLLVLGAAGLYQQIGAPGYPDLPINARLEAAEMARINRPSQAVAEAEADLARLQEVPANEEFLALMDQLRAAVAQRPGDIQGLTLLARNEAQLGNFIAAYKAQEQLITAKGRTATPQDLADLADMMILAAGGYVSPEAEGLLIQVMEAEPSNGIARYYSGLMFTQTGRPDASFEIWRSLLAESPPDAPWVTPIRRQIEEVAMRAGVPFTLPPLGEQVGPSREEIAAAQGMTPDDRMAMIEGMVDSLSDRLATEGGTAEEWARLINALGVLNRYEPAKAIWAEAQTVFADRPEDLARVRDVALQWDLLE